MHHNNTNSKLDDFCNELENLSSQMVKSFSQGDYNIVKTIDTKRKLILNEISKDLDSLSKRNKSQLKLVWTNNKKLITNFEKEMKKNTKNINEKKKLFIAYSKF